MIIAVQFEPRSRIMNLTRPVAFAKVHAQVTDLLGGPVPGWDAK
jgi:hypothetical protein